MLHAVDEASQMVADARQRLSVSGKELAYD